MLTVLASTIATSRRGPISAGPFTLCKRKVFFSHARGTAEGGKEGTQAYTKCQVEYYHVRVKVFVVVTIVRVKGEICGRYTPTGIQVKRTSSRPALEYLRRYVGAVSRPEIDLNAEHSRSHHGVVSTAIHIERRAVGGAAFVE
jgi:hypothetical protein